MPLQLPYDHWGLTPVIMCLRFLLLYFTRYESMSHRRNAKTNDVQPALSLEGALASELREIASLMCKVGSLFSPQSSCHGCQPQWLLSPINYLPLCMPSPPLQVLDVSVSSSSPRAEAPAVSPSVFDVFLGVSPCCWMDWAEPASLLQAAGCRPSPDASSLFTPHVCLLVSWIQRWHFSLCPRLCW